MKRYVATVIVMLAAPFLTSGLAYAASKTVFMNLIEPNSVGKEIGTLRLSDTEVGLQIIPDLADLPPGEHGFHLHVNPNCGPGNGPDGQPAAGLAAGGHYDPADTAKHLGPHGDGHKGDLPVLIVDASGKATKAVVAPRLKVSDVENHTVMIHAGGDNYSDQPAPVGGGGPRIACGVVK
jgi:superoxide dismutase, Cu-Zn family